MLLAFAVSLVVVLLLLLVALARDMPHDDPRAKGAGSAPVHVLNINRPVLFVLPQEHRHAKAMLPLLVDEADSEGTRVQTRASGSSRYSRAPSKAALRVINEFQSED